MSIITVNITFHNYMQTYSYDFIRLSWTEVIYTNVSQTGLILIYVIFLKNN